MTQPPADTDRQPQQPKRDSAVMPSQRGVRVDESINIPRSEPDRITMLESSAPANLLFVHERASGRFGIGN
jgi:hypothetical protein